MWEFLAAVLAAAPTNIFGICQAAEAKYIIGKSPYFWCCNQGKEEREKERQGKCNNDTGWSNHAWIDDAPPTMLMTEGMRTGIACDRYDINGMNH